MWSGWDQWETNSSTGPFLLTLRLLGAPIPDACADPLEEPIVLDVIPNAISDVVDGGSGVVDELVGIESLVVEELDDQVDVTAPWALALLLVVARAMTTIK